MHLFFKRSEAPCHHGTIRFGRIKLGWAMDGDWGIHDKMPFAEPIVPLEPVAKATNLSAG
jgi:hypothetical protein